MEIPGTVPLSQDATPFLSCLYSGESGCELDMTGREEVNYESYKYIASLWQQYRLCADQNVAHQKVSFPLQSRTVYFWFFLVWTVSTDYIPLLISCNWFQSAHIHLQHSAKYILHLWITSWKLIPVFHLKLSCQLVFVGIDYSVWWLVNTETVSDYIYCIFR